MQEIRKLATDTPIRAIEKHVKLSKCAPHSMSRSRGLSPTGWSLSLALVPAVCSYFVSTVMSLSWLRLFGTG
jgi:hypothetical protein